MFQPPAAHSCCPRCLLSSASQSPTPPPKKEPFSSFFFSIADYTYKNMNMLSQQPAPAHSKCHLYVTKTSIGGGGKQTGASVAWTCASCLPSENMEEKRERENKQRQEARKRLTVGTGWGKRTVIEYKHGKCDGVASGSWGMCHVVRGKRFPPRDGGRAESFCSLNTALVPNRISHHLMDSSPHWANQWQLGRWVRAATVTVLNEWTHINLFYLSYIHSLAHPDASLIRMGNCDCF